MKLSGGSLGEHKREPRVIRGRARRCNQKTCLDTVAEQARTTIGPKDQVDKTGTSRIEVFIGPGFYIFRARAAYRPAHANDSLNGNGG
jgi:hypothetical protein